ncbi:hypothetical protein P1J78_09330 [Psychromarinibacter sp. C21-152]|uniref:DUF7742 domain-containing protein n=1 Tax=Psychromarinibacter sediminicola TaxID=3033385 RepID=A0AAE3NUN6_9RHOB|nr:hypothetical protein [Psychromarinibacter sediminicola]MDF0600932.1 hypothetical protein [Psychromarinibacter sediminicola]
MRPVMHGDVVAAARVLVALPAGARAGRLDRLIRAAGWADRFRRRYRRAHPYWGDGSLMAVALTEDPPPEPRLSDPEYCKCLSMVLEAVAGEAVSVPG